ncbi:MAG: hypothetical protein ACUVRJ_01475 [Candidatus Villigracilaceae bacterium]
MSLASLLSLWQTDPDIAEHLPLWRTNSAAPGAVCPLSAGSSRRFGWRADPQWNPIPVHSPA